MRVARPTDHLEALAVMYQQGLGLEVLGRFDDHQGFDGIMLGHPGQSYHVEFTSRRGHRAGRAPTEDNLLVFYVPDAGEWEADRARMRAAGFREVRSYNPYWDRNGATFEDLDGYRVVLQKAEWSS